MIAAVTPRSRRMVLFALLGAWLAVCASTPRIAAGARPHAAAPDFTLVDQFGRQFSLARHIGQPLVLFFGYSHCGDVCPLTLAKLERAKAAAGAAAKSLQVVFITVDPRRDSPPVLRRFIEAFDPSFVALTGSDEQLARAYAGYHVTHRVLASQRGAVNYDVEHTSLLYFIGRDGRFRGFGDWTDSQQIVTQSVSELVARGSDEPSHRAATRFYNDVAQHRRL
jgi:protein SCO1